MVRTKLVTDHIPENYSTPEPVRGLRRQIRGGDGNIYTLLGCSEETLSNGEKLLTGINISLQIYQIVTDVLSLSILDEMDSLWYGRRIVLLYSSSPFLTTKILAKQGDMIARYKLAVMYYKGEGVQQSFDRAVKHCQIAADGGFAMAQYQFGLACLHGECSDARGMDYLKKAAVKGHRPAQRALQEIEQNKDQG